MPPKDEGIPRTLSHEDIRSIAEVTSKFVTDNLDKKVLGRDEIRDLIREEMDDIVAASCKAAVQETLAHIGLSIDGEGRMETMKDFLFVREWRKFFNDGKRHAWFAFMTVVIGGICMAIITYMRVGGPK